MDTSDPDIRFNESGLCNHCLKVESILKKEPYSLSQDEKNKRLEKLINQVKLEGRNNEYNCIIGVSGGVDSTYVAYVTKKWGLKPLAVHLDNGWNTELSLKNVEVTCRKLDIDLYTHVLDWEEFRNLQISFFKSSTADLEVISDHAITALMYKMAAKVGVKYILAGTNFASESILPDRWSYGHRDWKYIKSVHKRFSSKKLNDFPHLGLLGLNYHVRIKKTRFVSILDYLDYDKEKAKKILIKELCWKDYGGKHNESLITKFHINYILPTKFGNDKRRAHLSSLIMAGQISRHQALIELEKPQYEEEQMHTDKEYVLKKLGFSESEFDKIMASPSKTYWDYPSYNSSRLYKFKQAIRGVRNRQI
jgi:N-acetyl sugar amidotransferase